MAAITVVIHVQAVRDPANCERGRHSPEKTTIEVVVRRVGIVIDGISARVVIISGSGLIHDHALRLVVRHVNDVVGDRRDLDDAVMAFDVLVVVAAQVAGGVSSVAEAFYGAHDIFLLRDHGFAEPPCPVHVFVHESDDLRVVEKRDDRIVPHRVRLE